MDISEDQLAEVVKVKDCHSYKDMCVSVLVEFGDNSF